MLDLLMLALLSLMVLGQCCRLTGGRVAEPNKTQSLALAPRRQRVDESLHLPAIKGIIGLHFFLNTNPKLRNSLNDKK